MSQMSANAVGVRFVLPRWLSQRILSRPAKPIDAGFYAAVSNTQCLRPLSHGHGLTITGQKMIRACIIRLLLLSSPHDILRSVRTIIIKSFKGMFGRGAQPHIFEKLLEGMTPLITDRNPSASIAVKKLIPWVQYAGFHISPSSVFRRPMESNRCAVRLQQAAACFLSTTATVARNSLVKRIARDTSNSSTLTFTFPLSVLIRNEGEFSQSNPSSERLTWLYGGIYRLCHRRSSISSVVLGGSCVASRGAALLFLFLFVSPVYAGLRHDAAAHGLKYGCATKSSFLLNDPPFSAAFAMECGILTPETQLKMSNTASQPWQWNFSQAKTLASFAAAHGMELYGHTLVWHINVPVWVQALSASQRQDFMVEHIQRSIQAFPQIQKWDVVNEYFSGGASSIWAQAMGEGYVDIAFKTARQACAHCTLVLNEYDIESSGGKQQAMLELLDRLKSRGVPVNAVGIEAHLFGTPNREQFLAFVAQVHARGLEVFVTELDVNSSDDTHVATTYRAFVSMAKDAGIRHFVTWGLSDKYTWLGGQRPLPLDVNMQKKPAYFALLDAFQGVGSGGTGTPPPGSGGGSVGRRRGTPGGPGTTGPSSPSAPPPPPVIFPAPNPCLFAGCGGVGW